MSDNTVAVPPDKIEDLRILTIRRALRIEIETTMRRSSRGRPTIVLANEISGCKSKNKRVAFKALNDYIVKNFGADFNMELKS